MKRDKLKYFFLVFSIVIISYSIYAINKKGEVPKESKVIEVTHQEVAQNLRLAIANYDTINPIISNNKYVQDISKLIYEPLITITPEYKTEMCLATEWAKTSNTTYVIKLREDVKWSNGEEFSGEDVLYTMDRIKEGNSIYKYNVSKVIQIDVIDKYTIKITLSEEVPFFEYNLNFPIMSKNYCGGEDFNTSEKTRNPIGTGAYKLSMLNSNSIELVKNDIWWNKSKKESKIENIKINLYSSTSEMYNDFKLGKIDLINTNNINIEEYIGTIGFNKKEETGRQYDYLAINTTNQTLAQKEVRQAIMYSINKSEIVSSIYQNKYFISQMSLSNGNWLYQGQNNNSYDVSKANQILKDNGWEFKYQYWQKNINYYTRKLNFRLLVNSTDELKVKVAELIKNQLEAVGIKITLVKVGNAQYENYLKYNNYDIVLCTTNTSVNPNLSMYFGENNIANYNNTEVKAILNEINNITDESMLKEKYKRICEIYTDEVPYIGLYNNYNMIAYSKELSGGITANYFNIFYNISNWSKK